MGKLYQQVEQFITPSPQEIWIEIGSDRWEGSSLFFGNLAQKHAVDFYSIDLKDSSSRRVHHPNIRWQISEGLQWCQTVLPTLDKKVGLVYLDNFDYAWNVNQWNDHIRDQRKEYLEKFGVEMTNQNCQLAHIQQMLAIEPFLTHDATVICDDTYTLNDCWVGKGGGVVLYLLAKGWQIKVAQDFGVILKPCNV